MTTIVEKNNLPRDHYRANLEDGSLVMKPYCACGNVLNEDYYCEKCQKKCHCNQIICDDEATLQLVKTYIRKSSQFSVFKAKLANDV
jgi:hypothetical protein